MKLKRIFAALVVTICIFLGLFTLKSNRLLNTVPPKPDQSADAQTIIGGQFGGPIWKPADKATIKAVSTSIVGQLDAFKKDDYELAASFQSQRMKQNFFNVEGFRQMIKDRYPAFASYKTVSFQPVMMAPNMKVVAAPVKVTGTNGDQVEAIYILVLEEGTYRVAEVEGGEFEHVVPVPADPSFS